jgi:alpha-tubulin suppressor-like RCC1 family protein
MRPRTILHAAPLALAAAVAILAACADHGTNPALAPTGPNTPRMSVIPTTPYTLIDGGQVHACGLASSGQAYCWGRNALGTLGDSTAANSSVPVTVFQQGVSFVTLSAGAQHNCALDASGQAYCWGYNADGRLGDSTVIQPLIPVPVHPIGAVSFQTISAGGNHTCGLVSGGQAYCWGNNSWGQIGDSSTVSPWTPVAVHQNGVSYSQVVAGNNFTCALASSGGQAYCWGYGGGGAVGNNSFVGTKIPNPVQQGAVSYTAVYAEYDYACALDASGQAYCWGNNASGQLGDSTTTTRKVPVAVHQPSGVAFTDLALGGSTACGLTSGGQAYCWGNGGFGVLGDGTTVSKLYPVAVSQPAGVTFTSIRAESPAFCGLDGNGQTWCWGRNIYGGLGDGTTTNRSTPVAVSQ